MEILSSFTPVVSYLYEFSPPMDTKEDILMKVGNQTVDGSHSLQ